jgi:hypothetical protein
MPIAAALQADDVMNAAGGRAGQSALGDELSSQKEAL